MKSSSLHLKAHRWHKRFGLALAVVTIMWGLSGIAHPLMSRIKPVAQAQLPLQALNISQLSSIGQILETAPESNDALILNRQGQAPVIALQTASGWQYHNAKTGERLQNFKDKYLSQLGALYAGLDKEQAKTITLIHQFDYDYPRVNRYLPAYKVEFSDDLNTTVYLDAQSLQLANVSNQYKRFYTRWFSHLHSWDFIPNHTFRYGLMILVTLLLFLSALLGVYLSIRRWRQGSLHKGTKTRRAHRYIGLTVCLAALAFSFSGGFHALNKLVNGNTESYSQKSSPKLLFNPNDYRTLWEQFVAHEPPTNIQQIQLIAVAGHPVLQLHHLTEAPIRHGGHQHGKQKRLIRGDISYFPKEVLIDGQLVSTGTLYLQQLLSQISPKEIISDFRLQPHFNHEYGFIDKKLPTYRIETEESLYFIDPTAQSLSKQVSQQKLLESMSFSVLHKASFLDGLGRDIRDIIIVLFVLGIIAITMLGLRLSLKRRSKP
ncbi:PepSY domain-containing protein [Kangiella geojedonensis]|uniref:PepSY-associated TM helix domain protein n=1 Tax=Kangiella geojedonensis TaxID=914150 RepID=A0A0F6RCS3_9GAMM|nr:PepSY domain-containing protein [Kangiella geojedonensis]AKE52668.1 hypothetical protein TQ33_1727 [Kangiella geojedonensis]